MNEEDAEHNENFKNLYWRILKTSEQVTTMAIKFWLNHGYMGVYFLEISSLPNPPICLFKRSGILLFMVSFVKLGKKSFLGWPIKNEKKY